MVQASLLHQVWLLMRKDYWLMKKRRGVIIGEILFPLIIIILCTILAKVLMPSTPSYGSGDSASSGNSGPFLGSTTLLKQGNSSYGPFSLCTKPLPDSAPPYLNRYYTEQCTTISAFGLISSRSDPPLADGSRGGEEQAGVEEENHQLRALWKQGHSFWGWRNWYTDGFSSSTNITRYEEMVNNTYWGHNPFTWKAVYSSPPECSRQETASSFSQFYEKCLFDYQRIMWTFNSTRHAEKSFSTWARRVLEEGQPWLDRFRSVVIETGNLSSSFDSPKNDVDKDDATTLIKTYRIDTEQLIKTLPMLEGLYLKHQEDGGKGTSDDDSFVSEEQVLKHVNPANFSAGTISSDILFPDEITSNALQTGATIVTVLLHWAFIPIAITTSGRLVDEKRNKIREHLRVIGTRPMAYLLAIYSFGLVRDSSSFFDE